LEAFVRAHQRLARGQQFALRRSEFLVRRLEAAIELRLFLLQKRHFIGFLLDALRLVALGRHVQHHQPDAPRVAIEMQIGGASPGQFDRWHEIRRLGERQNAFEEKGVLEHGLADANLVEAVIVEPAADPNHRQCRIDLHIGEGTVAVGHSL
jgi:hypothetical protein